MTGKVYIAGAGPGSIDLLTVKTQRLIDAADVILYDSLTGDEIIETFPSPTIVIDVGKKPGPNGRRRIQDEINELLVEHARQGDIVLRLKGGDPTIFGRGGEEAEYLARNHVPFEIVPGVSSIAAAPGVVGIPVTHRDHSSSITIVPGYEDPTKTESAIDWSALAQTIRAGGTLLILMGVGRLADNVAALRREGLSSTVPVAMIERATWSEEQTIVGSLGTIVDRAEAADIQPPAMTVVGDVVETRETISEFLHRDSVNVDISRPVEHLPPVNPIREIRAEISD